MPENCDPLKGGELGFDSGPGPKEAGGGRSFMCLFLQGSSFL